MNREKLFREIEDTLGLVPTMFKQLPDDTLETEWKLFKKIELEETKIPNKYKELMGIAVASATKCQYCIFFHTEAARLFGATEEEIQEAVQYTKNSMGWSTYLNGMQIDIEQFRDEVKKISNYIREDMIHHQH